MSNAIKVISEPSVYLVGHPELSLGGISTFLEESGVPEWQTDADFGEYLVEMAGRLCYLSFAKPRPGGNKAYIGHLLDVGHGSVLEHAVFNVILTGVSRSFTHELVRHRAGFGYSQLSQRYVDESDVAFVVPPMLLPCHAEWQTWACKANTLGMTPPDGPARLFYDWRKGRESDIKEYCELSEQLSVMLSHVDDKTARRKMAREAARSVLPNCTETKIFVTANARALRHFIEMRANPAADAEIRRVAVALLRVLQSEAPNIFGDYTIEPCDLGGEQATTPHKKV